MNFYIFKFFNLSGLRTTSEVLDKVTSDYSNNNETFTKSSFGTIHKTSSEGPTVDTIEDLIATIFHNLNISTKENTFGRLSLLKDQNRSKSRGTKIFYKTPILMVVISQLLN